MRALLLFSLYLILIIPAAKSQGFYKSTPERKKIIHLIAALPEVADEKKYLKKAHIKMVIYIDQIPTSTDNNYHVAVAEDRGWILMNHRYFSVNPATHAIKYFAVAEGKDIPISVWRKHHYRDY